MAQAYILTVTKCESLVVPVELEYVVVSRTSSIPNLLTYEYVYRSSS